MRPVEGHEFVWTCARHSIFARIVNKDEAASLSRGDDFTMHDGSEGSVVRQGDERQGGLLIYYRAR